jgi:hypothetical protein
MPAFEHEWRQVDTADDATVLTLGILAHDDGIHRVLDVARVLQRDPADITGVVNRLSFLRVDDQAALTFTSDSFRKFAAGKLGAVKRVVQDKLIDDLGTLNAKRSEPLRPQQLRGFMQVASTLPLDDAYPIVVWAVTNVVTRFSDTDQARTFLRPLFEATLLACQMSARMTAGGGLQVGTSYRSIGEGKDSEISQLSADEAEINEADVDRFLNRVEKEHQGERVLYNLFTL